MINIAIAGCGKQAEKHIKTFLAMDDVTVTVADLAPERAEALAKEFGVASVGLDDLFSIPNLNALDICTPTPSHYELARQGLEAGLHVFCEKPLCESTAQAKTLDVLARKHDRVLQVGYIYRFATAFEEAKQIMDNPEEAGLGKPVWAMFRIGGRGSHRAWKHDGAAGGGAINEMLAHMADLAYWLFGPLKDVRLLSGGNYRSARVIEGQTATADAEDFVLVKCTSKDGVEIVLQADLLTPSFFQYAEIHGENGSFFGSIQPNFPSRFAPAGSQPKAIEPRTDLYAHQLGTFISRARSGETNGICSAEESVEVMQTLETVRKGLIKE